MFSLSSYPGRSGGSYGGSSHRHFGSSARHRKNWERFPLTGTPKGDDVARKEVRRVAEDQLFLRR